MSELSLSMLGSFAASLDGKSLLPFRAKSVQALLTYLVCEAGQLHQREALMDLLWPGMPLASAQANLRQTVYRLRQAIPEVHGRQSDKPVPFVLAERRTIQINPEAVYTADVQQFADFVERDPEQAITLYRGDFLADFYLPDSETFEEWVNGRRAHTQRQILTALDEVTAVHLQNGRYDAAEELARRQLTLDNLLESGHRQLMEALAGNGRRRAALSHYESLSQLLQAELDIEPSAATQTLVQAIRSGELAEGKEKRVERQEVKVERTKVEIEQTPLPTPRSPRPTPTLRHNLPVQATPFIGRSAELATLAELIADPAVRLVTIVGSGGMGKTRLALAAAEQQLARRDGSETHPYSDGIYFIDLAPLTNPDQMVSAVADALKFPLQSEENRTPRQQLLDYLRHQQMLLLFDNCEHLLDGVDLLADMLQTAPALQLLATSRERLHIRSEQLFLLGGLEFPDWETVSPVGEIEDAEWYTAVQLFLQSARRNQPDFALHNDNDLTYLARICRTVAGMPLALELAAAWVDMLPLAEIAAGLQEGLDFLETEMRDVPERHGSVRAAIDYSWAQLDEKERDIFAKLSVFRGGFTRQAAQAVAGANLRQLGRLVNKSFLQYAQTPDRYHIHDLMRQYGLEKLQESGREAEVRDQHSQFFCTALQQWQAGLQSNQLRQTADAVDADYRNVEAAWEYALEQEHWERLLLAVNGLGTYFDVNGRWLEGITIFQKSARWLQANSKATPATVAATRLLIWLSAWQVNLDINARGELSDPQSVYQQLLQPAVDLLQQPLLSDMDYRAEEAYLRLQLGRVLKYFGEHEAGRTHLTTCLRLYRELDNPLGIADALYEIHFYISDEEHARDQLQESLALLQQVDEPRRLNRLLIGMGLFLQNVGALEEIPILYEQAYEAAQRVQYLRGMFEARRFAISQTWELGQLDLALSQSEELLALAQQTNDPNSQVIALSVLAMARLYGGQFLLALDTFQEAVRYEREMGLPNLSGGLSYFGLPQTYLHTGQYEETLTWLKAMGYELWYLIINQMWVSLIRQAYEWTLVLGQQAIAKLAPVHKRKGRAEIGSPLALALYELDRKEEARRELVQYLQFCLGIRTAFIQLMPLIPVIARVLADAEEETQKLRAVELWAMAQALPFVGNSKMFADLMGERMAALERSLPPDKVAVAQAKGRALDWWETAESLLDELTALGWRGDVA